MGSDRSILIYVNAHSYHHRLREAFGDANAVIHTSSIMDSRLRRNDEGELYNHETKGSCIITMGL